jgi:hypothetical protein
MRIYRIIGTTENKERTLGFTRREAQARKATNRIPFDLAESVHYEAEDIPSGKDGLIAWLSSFIADDEILQIISDC